VGERPESPNAVNSLGDGVAEEGAWAHGARDQSRSPHPREVGGVAGPRVMASLRRPLRQRSGRRRLIALPSPFPHGSDGRFAATHERPPLAKVRQTYRRMGLAVVRCLNRAATFGSGFRWRHHAATAPVSPHFSWAGHCGVCFSLWHRPLRISGRSSGETLCFGDEKAMPTRWVNLGHADPRSHRTGQWSPQHPLAKARLDAP